MKCKIKQFKCAILTIMVLSFNFMSFRINAQNTQMLHWYINSSQNSVDVDFTIPSSGTYSYTVNNLPTSTGYTHHSGASNGFYDINGGLIFYIEDGAVYDKNGVKKYQFQFTGFENTVQCCIVPLANTCLEYYVVITTNHKLILSQPPRIFYGKVTIDNNQNIVSVTDEGQLGGFITNNSTFRCGFAVSNVINDNGERYLYLVEGDGNGPNYQGYFGYLKRFLITNNGISYQQTILSASNSSQMISYLPFEVDLSSDGSKISWGSIMDPKIYIIDLANNNTIHSYTTITSSLFGVEFNSDGSKLFYTEVGNTIKWVDATNYNSTINSINGTGSSNSCQIELGSDGILYSLAGNVDPFSMAVVNNNIPMHTFGLLGSNSGSLYTVSLLPTQIDGFDYYDTEHVKTCCAESYPYTINLGIGIKTSVIWTATSNPFQNGTSTISMEEGFEISSGTTIEIQNMNFEFGRDAKVVIHTGGKLILNGTNFSGLQDCNTIWHGVVVEGSTAYTQSPESNQGVFEMINNSYIKNARIGLYVAEEVSAGIYKGGGIIKIQQSHFVNNHIDIWMRPYQLSSTTTQKPLQQKSYIKDSYFTEDQNLIVDKYGNGKTNNMILWGIHGLNILGNKFENTNLTQEISKRGIGIMSSGSSFNVEPYCDPNITPCSILRRNEFNSLFYGIVCYEGTGSNNVIQINDNIFTNTYRSIILSGTYNAVVTLNNCIVPAYSFTAGITPYGLYINGGRDFKIEENVFSRGSSSPMFNGARGIIIHNTGAVNNEIYKNECNNLAISYQTQCFNSGEEKNSNNGLRFSCNISETDAYSTDLWINNITSCNHVPYSVIGPPMPNAGIAYHQRRVNPFDGIIPGSNYDNFLAADNRFSYSHFYLSPKTLVDINNEADKHIQYWFNGDCAPSSNNEVFLPTNLNITNTVPLPLQNYTYTTVGVMSYCPSKINNVNNNMNDLYNNLNILYVKLNSAEIILNIWKDGGNIELGEEVATTEPWEAYQQFNELMGTSPYLSEEVLIEIINNPVFSDLMVKLLMIANPQSIRSVEVMDALENRVPAMPQSYLDEIRASDDGSISQLEILEANVSSYNHAIDMFGQNIKRNYRGNFVDSWAKDSLIAFISRGNDLNDKFELAITYLEFEDYTNMQNTLNYISNNFELEDEMLSDFNDFQTFINIVKLLKQSNYSLNLTQEQKLSLEAIFTNDAPLIGAMALSILKRNDKDYIFNEQIDNLSQTSSRLSHKHVSTSEYAQSSDYKLYPNPAKDYTTIKYDCSRTNIFYTISDMQGRVLVERHLETKENQTINKTLIDLQTLSPGTYQFTIKSDTGIDWSAKLIIY